MSNVIIPTLRRLGIPDDQPELIRSQMAALRVGVPLLYVVLAIDALIFSRSLDTNAPYLLARLAPYGLATICLLRGLYWCLRPQKRLESAHEIAKALRVTTIAAFILGLVFLTWVMLMYTYCDDAMRLQLSLFVMLAVVGCTFCLMHLPVAAISLITIIILPFTSVYLFSGHLALVSVAANAMVVYFVVNFVTVNYYRRFKMMIFTQKDLIAQSAEVERLNTLAIENEKQRQKDRQSDLDRIASNFARSIETVTLTLGEVANNNACQSRDLAVCSDASIVHLSHVKIAAEKAERAFAVVAQDTEPLFAAIDAIRHRTQDATSISKVVEMRAGLADQAMVVLNKTIAQIDDIAGMIKTIAGQINLIALNATIEAARAGEAGRGFTVVASEIKSLASRTAHATDDIGRNIRDVKTASATAVSSVVEMKEAFSNLRSVEGDIVESLNIQTHMTDNIRGNVSTAVADATTMRQMLTALSDTAERTQVSSRGMLDRSMVLDSETNLLSRKVEDFMRTITAA